MISSSVFENSTSSMAAAEKADLVEALLRGELSREDYEEISEIINKKTYQNDARN